MVCVVGSRAGRLRAIDEVALRICDEDKHPFGRCVDVEHSQSISSRERGTTSQAFYRNGTKWRLEDQRGNCEEPVCRLRKPRLSMSHSFRPRQTQRPFYRERARHALGPIKREPSYSMVHGQRSGGPSPSDLTLCHNIEFGRARFDAGSAIDEKMSQGKACSQGQSQRPRAHRRSRLHAARRPIEQVRRRRKQAGKQSDHAVGRDRRLGADLAMKLPDAD